MKQTAATEKLIGAAMLLGRAGTELESDETIVELSMEPWEVFRPDYGTSKIEAESVFVGLLRTAGYFVLDHDEALPALRSNPPVGEIADFPPLPFARIWIETKGMFGPEALIDYPGEEDTLNILGIGIIERDPGKLWDVLLPYEFVPHDGSDPGRYNVLGHTITPQGFADETGQVQEQDWAEEGSSPATAIIGLAITASHLITAERMPITDIPIGRPQRKRWNRELKRQQFEEGPRVYFVDLKTAGDIRVEGYGGGREYKVRWIVRGHYYKHPNGKFDIPEKGKCYWRKAYVKGPAGAPWKGRPIYVGGKGTPIE